MNAKLKILCLGTKSYVELDGKTIGKGVEYIHFEHNAGKEARCQIGINLNSFEFMPDGSFDKAVHTVAETRPPAQRPWPIMLNESAEQKKMYIKGVQNE